MKHTFNLNIPADCEDPAGYVREAIESFQASQGELTGDISVKINTENHAIPQIVRDAIPEINVEDAYPKPGESVPLRGCMKHAIIVDDAPYIKEGKENVADLNKAPKVDIMIKDGDVVAVDMVKEYTPFIRKWAEDRNIIGGGSTTLDQFIKGLTEAGELWTHIGKGQRELMKDDIGDVYVCLVNAAGNLDINLEDAVRPLENFGVHGGRALYKAKGLKRWSLQVLYNMAAAARAIENILDADNERDVEFFKTDFSEACADVVYVLETIALENDWSLSECVIEAYNDIKDRKGLMVSGCFVKESDFTVDMVSAALDDDRVKPETKEYLRQWCMQQLSNEAQEMEAHDLRAESLGEGNVAEPMHDVVVEKAEVKKPFWRIWNEAQGNKDNLAPFVISAEVAHLLSNQKDDQIVATLGVFGQANHNHEVFVMDLDNIKAAMDRLVGKIVGEVDNPRYEHNQGLTAWVERITTVDQRNAAGVLVDYAINVLGEGSHGPIIEVVGLVEPSALTKDRVATAGNVYFGIRSLIEPKIIGSLINRVEALICFDLATDNPREMK